METLHDIVQIKKDPIPEMSKSGKLYLPDMVRDCVDQNTERGVFLGTVTCVGPECRTVKVGNRVLFGKGFYELYETDEGPRCGMHERDIFAQVEGEEDPYVVMD